MLGSNYSGFLPKLVLFLLSGVVNPLPSIDGETSHEGERGLQSATAFPTFAPLTDGVQEALMEAKDLWIGSDIVAYELGFTRQCFCIEEYRAPYVSIVDSGTIVSVLEATNGTMIDPNSDLFFDAYSVEILFDKIQEALDGNAYEIRVDYDTTFGYPTSLYIDYEAIMADEEFIVVIDSFQVLEEGGNSTSESGEPTIDESKNQSPTGTPKGGDDVAATPTTGNAALPSPTSAVAPTPTSANSDSSSSLSRSILGVANGVWMLFVVSVMTFGL